ncbi:MAG: cyclic nucleotide-binding domain-containing protein [Polyangiaceae bacterium]|nr:cyclic nucleotide-binding domain-containing protein [Polyangiaceae bacterium]
MTITPADLAHLPLFRSLKPEQTKELLAAFVPRKVSKGQVLFREGEVPQKFQLLAEGEIELTEAREPKITVRPIAPIGELGALTGVPRNTTAVATRDSRLLEVDREALMKVFSRSADLAFLFYKGLLDVVSDKVRRDKQRLDEMRDNIIRTQKAMKELRDVVLAADETPISQPVCDRLDDLIEHNRRSHYRVSPIESHPASVRLNGGPHIPVVELSEGFLKLASTANLAQGAEATLVLALPKGEIPVSGRVERLGTDGILFKLDLLIDEYKQAMAGYMTELQMLDFVV